VIAAGLGFRVKGFAAADLLQPTGRAQSHQSLRNCIALLNGGGGACVVVRQVGVAWRRAKKESAASTQRKCSRNWLLLTTDCSARGCGVSVGCKPHTHRKQRHALHMRARCNCTCISSFSANDCPTPYSSSSPVGDGKFDPMVITPATPLAASRSCWYTCRGDRAVAWDSAKMRPPLVWQRRTVGLAASTKPRWNS